MFFTQEDFLKIEEWLKQRAIRNTEFNEVSLPLKGNEIISIVQEDGNKKMFVKDFITQMFKLGVEDFLNISDKYKETYIDLEHAIQLIPYNARKIGQVITFLNTGGNWVTYQFTGESLNQWTHLPLWVSK